MSSDSRKEAIFPLTIFLLPGEETYLHIFEPRYRELLEDLEESGIDFGIYYRSDKNRSSVGSLMQLVRVVKKYDTGESDILVKCKSLYHLDWFYDKLDDKLYPGGDIRDFDYETKSISLEMSEELNTLLELRGEEMGQFNTLTEAAISLNLKSEEKLSFVKMTPESREKFIKQHIDFNKALIEQEQKTKFNFHLN